MSKSQDPTSGESGSPQAEPSTELSHLSPEIQDMIRRQIILDEALTTRNPSKDLAELTVEGLGGYDFTGLAISEKSLPGFVGERLRAPRLALSLADLPDANLRSGSFEAAAGPRSNLEGANLEASDWKGAILTNANLKRVKARGASFISAILNGADLTEGDFRGARFDGAYLINTKGLETAQLEGASFTGAYQFNDEDVAKLAADLSIEEAVLRAAIFAEILTGQPDHSGSVLEQAREKGLILGNSVLKMVGVSVAGRLYPGIVSQGLQAQEMIFTKTNFSGGDFTGADFDSSVGVSSQARGTKFTGSTFRNALLRGMDLTEAWLPGVDFTDADLSGADVTGANLSGAIFERTNLDRVIGLDKAIKDGTVFRNVYQSNNVAIEAPREELDS